MNAKGKSRLAPSVRTGENFSTINVIPKNFKVQTGYEEIGRGTYGVIRAAYRNRSMKNINVTKLAIKRNTNTANETYREFLITKKIRAIVPKHVVNIRSLSKNRLNITMNLYRGGAIGDWLKQPDNADITDDALRVIILQFLFIMFKIHRSDPTFRHNDTHLGNIFINDRVKQDTKFGPYTVQNYGVTLVLADFGISLDSQYPLPGSFNKKYGIYPGSDKMYDVHLFLNMLYSKFVQKRRAKFPFTYKFLSDILSDGYSGETNTSVSHYRLKYGKKYPYDYEYLMGHPYFSVPLKQAKSVVIMNDKLKKIIRKNLTQTNVIKWGGTYKVNHKLSNAFLLNPAKYFPNLAGVQSLKSPPKVNRRSEFVKKYGIVIGERMYKKTLKNAIDGMNKGKYRLNKSLYTRYYGNKLGTEKYNKAKTPIPKSRNQSFTYRAWSPAYMKPNTVSPVYKARTPTPSPTYMKPKTPMNKGKGKMYPTPEKVGPSRKKTIYNYIQESNFKTLRPRNIYNKLVEMEYNNPKQRVKNLVEKMVKKPEAWEKARAALQGIANVSKR